MNRRRVLKIMGTGLLVAGASDLHADEPVAALARFAAVEWQRYAVMTKPLGAEPPWRLRLEGEHAAARAGGGAVEELLRFTEHASPHVRGFAAQMLGVIGDRKCLPRLKSLLASDPAPIVRNYAVEALSRLPRSQGDDVIAAAIAAARSDANGNVRFSAQQAELRLQKRVPTGTALRAAWTRGFDRDRLGTARVGRPAPGFELTADDGHRVRLADYRDRSAVVLLFQLADW